MAARPLATATVSFGLVSIPARLYSTSETSRSISLNRLHKKCGGRLKQQYVCPTDDEIVTNDDTVKGYEFAKGQYVKFEDDEIKALYAQATETIDITEFVNAEQVDPIFFEKSYFLGPNKGGERPYRLLAQAMQQMGRCAIANYAARGKEYLVLLRPYKDGLIMQQMYHADELRSFDEVPLGDAEVKESELKLAEQLIEQITSEEFDATKYKDHARERMHEMIQQKIEGREITSAPAEEPKAQIIDLMAALKASLGAKGEAVDEGRKGPKRVSRRSAEKKAVGGEG